MAIPEDGYVGVRFEQYQPIKSWPRMIFQGSSLASKKYWQHTVGTTDAFQASG
jgi:hypothetical protein